MNKKNNNINTVMKNREDFHLVYKGNSIDPFSLSEGQLKVFKFIGAANYD